MNSALNKTTGMFPRHIMIEAPTPLTRLNRISEHFDIDLWIKRDDLAGPTLGGNKTRQLEYYFGAALAKEADTILITGAVQSNFVRIAAAIAASLGLDAVIQLEHRVNNYSDSYKNSGNVLLNKMFGARIVYYPEGGDENGADNALYQEAERLTKLGKRPYVIPLGKNRPPLGALGYVNCAAEIVAQAGQCHFNEVVIGSGSGASHLGMIAGMKRYSPNTKVVGSCVRRKKTLQKERLIFMSKNFNDMVDEAVISDCDIELWDGALAPGYGILGDTATTALRLLAKLEGQVVDPAYTAKVFACVVERCSNMQIKKGNKILFVHSGGLAGLFGYQNELVKIFN
jgi:D-cysteine desulfhydrase family pyridoxal phosphate-dependent enzyme